MKEKKKRMTIDEFARKHLTKDGLEYSRTPPKLSGLNHAERRS